MSPPANIFHCQRCPLRQQGCGGPCHCTIDDVDIIHHAQAGYCPDPGGARFGTGERPEAWQDGPSPGRAEPLPFDPEATARAAAAAAAKLAEIGRSLWGELHRKALAADDVAAFVVWVKWDFSSRIPCGECRNHWQTILIGELPAVFLSADQLFPWGVAAHNSVNRRLGKPEMSIEEARGIHG